MMGHMKDVLVTIYGGGQDAVDAAVALAGLEKHMQAQVAIDNATGDITDIVTVLRGAGFAALSPSADPSASLLHYCVNHAADEIERLREKCNSRTRWLQICMKARYEQLTDAAKEFADALFAEELEPESEPPRP